MEREKPLISILITHYNRPTDLFKCIKAIQESGISNFEIVVSDDASTPENLNNLENYAIDTLILSDVNKGLAANINKGIKACKGEYILYCQEDFVLNKHINKIIPECITLLKNNELDIVRFTSNFKFNKLKPLTDTISEIPKFSFKNFTQNYYRYSDHPFITKKSFYNSFGYYLENTSGRYGETEYCMRICNTKAKIGITNKPYASNIEGSQSILINEFAVKPSKVNRYKRFIKLARAFRLYFEWVFYNKTKRGLITYKNGRA